MLEHHAKPVKNTFNVSWISTIRYFELPADYTCNIGDRHEELELIFVEKGVFIEDSEDKKVILKAGDIVVYGSDYLHNNHCDGTHSASVFITSFGCKSAAAQKFKGRNFFHADSEIKNLVSMAINQGVKTCDINSKYCTMHPDATQEDLQMYKNIIEYLMLKLLRQQTEKAQHSERIFMQSNIENMSGLSGEIIAYLEENVYSNITIDDICKKFGYSKCHVCKSFKTATNTTIIDFYNNLKIEEAKRLLLETNTTIEEISVTLGYDTPQYFSKVFKKYTNMNPKHFKHCLFKGGVRK